MAVRLLVVIWMDGQTSVSEADVRERGRTGGTLIVLGDNRVKRVSSKAPQVKVGS